MRIQESSPPSQLGETAVSDQFPWESLCALNGYNNLKAAAIYSSFHI